MTDQYVDHEICVERYERLRRVINRSSSLAHRNRVGKVESVVIEGPGKRSPDQVTGRTRQNKLVHLESSKDLTVGAYAKVQITDAAGHYLMGELIKVTAPAKHRRRIPVVSA